MRGGCHDCHLLDSTVTTESTRLSSCEVVPLSQFYQPFSEHDGIIFPKQRQIFRTPQKNPAFYSVLLSTYS